MVKILSEQELRNRFAHYSQFNFQASTMVRQYSMNGKSRHKGDVARILTDSLRPFLPLFAYIDPADIVRNPDNTKIFEVWRRFMGEQRSMQEAPFYLFEDVADRASLYFILSISMQSNWRACLWSMDASTSILLSDVGFMHVNCSREDLFKRLDKSFHELALSSMA